jgi:uncharacterized protein YbjQ (UPF0145 family)
MFELGFFVVALVLGYSFGKAAERKHLRSIIKRENTMNQLPAIASRYPPDDPAYKQHLVAGNVVVASDYFKSFVAGLIGIFGGRVTPFESLLDRGRREAILRMKQEAEKINAELVFNVKLETTRIATGRVGAIEVLAYGTALTPANISTASAPSQPSGN